MHFTIHPTQLRDGTLVAYSFQEINFDNKSTSSSITTSVPSTQANANVTDAATTPSSKLIFSLYRKME